jgi:hypothetical protein
MKIIKGFALNRNFVNNTPNVVSDYGELSTVGYTFAKEPRVYSSTTYPTLSLVHFPSAGSAMGTADAIPDTFKEHIIKVMNAVYSKTASGMIEFAPGEFIDYINSQMGAAVADVKVGGVVVSGGRSIVEWVQWINATDGADNLIKVWFTNESFVGQFDEYDITVILPFDIPNQFFDQPQDVKNLLKSLTYAQEVERIDLARDNSSETKLWGNTYNYVNPIDRNDKTPAKFTALLYGPAADNVDVIKEKIVDYLLANSDFTRDQWKNILPDLFLRTEFLLFPKYSPMAIENVEGGVNGIYSPIVNLDEAMMQLVGDAAVYEEAHVRQYGQVLPFAYMSISLSVIGNKENRDDKFRLSDWFPDYFFAPNTSADFNRMSVATQNWAQMINQMLPIARDMTQTSTIPLSYSRVIRGNKMYLAKSIDNVQYLLAAPGTV